METVYGHAEGNIVDIDTHLFCNARTSGSMEFT
jgi:hypothetical protein